MRTAVCAGTHVLLSTVLATAHVTGNAAAYHPQVNIVAAPAAIATFESAPDYLVGDSWAENGILIEQVNGLPGTITTHLGASYGDGSRSWRPENLDGGWTRITKVDGSTFDAVSLLAGIPVPEATLYAYYELALDDAVVLSGTQMLTGYQGQWHGFSGGDFDEIRMRAVYGAFPDSLVGCPGPGGGPAVCNALFVDNIRVGSAVPVPVPATLALLLPPFLGLAVSRARRTTRRAC